MTQEPNRLFFALWPDDATRSACSDAARRLHARLQPGGRLERADRLHATLLFLGDVVSARNESAALQAASLVQAPPLTLTLDRAGSFPRKPKLWWLGSAHAHPGALAVHEQLRSVLRSAGVGYDLKNFAPHVTFLRDASKALAPTPVAPITWNASEFVLVRSVVQVQPSEYRVIGRWPLAHQTAKRSGSAQLDLWENGASLKTDEN